MVTDEDPELELCDDEPLSEVSDDVDDPLAAAAVLADELEPRLPVAAITPKASAKVASAAAVIRRRIILMRRARALRR